MRTKNTRKISAISVSRPTYLWTCRGYLRCRFWRKRNDFLAFGGLLLLQITTDRVQVVIEPLCIFFASSANFFDDGIVNHGLIPLITTPVEYK